MSLKLENNVNPLSFLQFHFMAIYCDCSFGITGLHQLFDPRGKVGFIRCVDSASTVNSSSIGRSNDQSLASKASGAITAAIPIGNSVSRMLLPIRLPTDILARALRTAATDMLSSGRLVPIPMMTTAMNDCPTFQFVANELAE